MIAHNPLHGSGQAGFPHPALALGNHAHAAQGIGMTDGRQGQPAIEETPHAIPEDAAILATPRQRAMPVPAHSEPLRERLDAFPDGGLHKTAHLKQLIPQLIQQFIKVTHGLSPVRFRLTEPTGYVWLGL
jgi:hypothetical protein